MWELDPNIATSKSSPGHVVGLNRPDQVFVLEKTALVVTRWDAGAPSNHSFVLLEQNPADFPLLDTEDGPTVGVLSRTFSPLAVMGFTSEVGPTMQPAFQDIGFPVVNDVLGFYGWTEIGFTSLRYMIVLQGNYRPFNEIERVKAAIANKRPVTELQNHVGVNWDVHLPR